MIVKKELFMDGTKLNRHLEEVVKWRQGEWFAPIHMEISVSNMCNQNCSFCYINWGHGKVNMPEDMLITLIRDAKKIGMKSALIAGEGEPTINRAYVRAIEVAGEVGLDMAFNTNAVLFSQDDLMRILPHLSWMRCSVQAATPKLYAQIHDAREKDFSQAINNIKMAAEIKRKFNLDVSIGVQQVLLKENGHEAASLAQLAKDIGADYYVVKPCHPHEDNKFSYITEDDLVEKFRDVLENAEKLSDNTFKAIVRWNFLTASKRTYAKCNALPFIIQIGATGDIYTCYPMAHRKEHLYGSLAEKSLEEILKSSKYQDTWKWVADNVDVSKCMPTCRQHNANTYLSWLTEETPLHNNFI